MVSGRDAHPVARAEMSIAFENAVRPRHQGEKGPFCMLLDSAPQRASAANPTVIPSNRESAAINVASFRPTARLSAWDYAGMFALFLFTLSVTVVNARGRIFWEDEMLGWLLLRDPSWHHMIHAWNLGADGGGFSFYLLGRGWFRIFGDSVLAFRLFTSTCFGLAFVTSWVCLRRFYSTGIVAFATFNSFFFSPPLTMHVLEGRFYGLLILCTALAMWLAFALEDAAEPTPKRLYFAAFLIHGFLTSSHLLGIVFSAFLLAATVVLDRMHRRSRWGLYLTVAVTWLLLLPERTSIVAAARVGRPHFWTQPPTALDLIGPWTGFSSEIRLVLVVLVAIACVALRQSTGGWRQTLRQQYLERRPVYVIAGALFLVPIWFLLEGFVGTWLFNERYLQPVTLVVAYITSELSLSALHLPLLVRLRQRYRVGSLAVMASGSVLFVAALFFWDFHHVAQNTPQAVDFTDQLTSHLPHDLPVVVDDAFTFTGLMSRQATSGVHYVFLLDWPFAVNPDAPRLEVTQYHLMENWKLAGYYADHIENAASFLRTHDRFLVLHSGLVNEAPGGPKPVIGNPLASRLAATPGFEVRKYFVLDRLVKDNARDTVWLVCRGRCAEPPPVLGAERCVITSKGTDCCSGPACRLPELPLPPRFWQVSSWWQ